VRAHIITGGRGGRINSRVLGFLGDAVRAHILTAGIPATDLTALGDDARAFLVHSSAALVESGLIGSETTSATLLEQSAGVASQFVQVRVVSSRPAPITGQASNVLSVSEDATRVLAAWDTPGGDVRYRESTDTGWAPAITLTLGRSLTREAAYKLLDQRLRSH